MADLKAANCFLAEDGSIKIGDMNVSKVMREGLLKVSGSAHTHIMDQWIMQMGEP